MTFETFDQTDFWKIFRFLKDFQIFGRFSDFWKIFRFLEDFQIFGRFSDFWKIFGRFSEFWKIFRFLEDFQIFGGFLEDFQIFWRFSDFWETTAATKTILGLVTLETLITTWIHDNLCYLTINCDTGHCCDVLPRMSSLVN